MKRVLILLTLIFACGIADGTTGRRVLVRVSFQFIEVPHSTLTDMLADREKSGPAIHEKAVALSKEAKAKLLETCMVVCLCGQKASLESIREEIYPTEYQPLTLPCDLSSNAKTLTGDPPNNPFSRTPTAFETRNTGVTLEVEPTLASDGTIDLRLNPEIVTRLRLETSMEHVDQWGDASYRMPIYETWRVKSSVNIVPGKFELVTALTPKSNAPVPAVSRKILVFVRADILPFP